MNRITPLQIGYGLLAIAGAVIPWIFNLQYMRANPGIFNPLYFFGQGFLSAAGSSLTADLLVVCTAIFMFIIAESRRLGMRYSWLLIPYSCMVAVASGLPLFLLLRERRLQQLTQKTTGSTQP